MPIRAIVFDLFDTLVDLSMEGLPRVKVREHEFPSSLGALHEVASGDVDGDDGITLVDENGHEIEVEES